MKRKVLLISVIILGTLGAFADEFVPEFDSMKYIRCDFEESVFEQNGTLVTKSNQHRFVRIDDPYKKIYLQKEPIDNVTYFGNDKIEFKLQSMTDDSIIMSSTMLDRVANTYSSTSEITYDSAFFGTRNAKAQGVCKPLN